MAEVAAAKSRARVHAALTGALVSATEAEAIGRATLEELARQREVIDAASSTVRVPLCGVCVCLCVSVCVCVCVCVFV